MFFAGDESGRPVRFGSIFVALLYVDIYIYIVTTTAFNADDELQSISSSNFTAYTLKTHAVECQNVGIGVNHGDGELHRPHPNLRWEDAILPFPEYGWLTGQPFVPNTIESRPPTNKFNHITRFLIFCYEFLVVNFQTLQ